MYLSIAFNTLAYYDWCDEEYIITVYLVNEVTGDYWHCDYTKEGDWVVICDNTVLLLTEKSSAMIYFASLSYKCLHTCRTFNITKFLLLQQILNRQHLQDLLYNIVYLST